METKVSKPIGGYFELELPRHEEYHAEAVALNSGRFGLEYILRCRDFHKVYVPYYTCDSAIEPIRKLGIEYEFYHIDKDYRLLDDIELSDGEALMYTNYWGLMDCYCRELASRYGRQLILDYTQSFYSRPVEGIDTFYSCRKFFGVPDGGYAYTDAQADFEIGQDHSFDRMDSLVKRIDMSAEEGYPDFRRVSDTFHDLPVRSMSGFTKRMMQSIDYASVAHARRTNYELLRSHLGGTELSDEAVPMIFPYECPMGSLLRAYLVKNRVFVAKYWPNVAEWAGEDSLEAWMSDNILPLPVDQRYGAEEMEHMINLIRNYHE